MIAFDKKSRSTQSEIMDSLDFKGAEMQNVLKDLKTVNKWLGGNKITIDGIKKLLKNQPKSQEIILLDIGCGDGESLRKCSDFGIKNGYNFKCIGIDFNQNIIDYAQQRSKEYPNLEFRKVDVISEENLIPNCDIALFTLFLHHLSNQEIEDLLRSALTKCRLGLIINDLHRSKQAFNLFQIASKILLRTKIARHDGLVSIARGFRKHEIQKISEQIRDQKSTIIWKWAYRYQWILNKYA